MTSRLRAAEVYDDLRGLSAFNMPADAKRVGANQYGTRYVFPDGSRLRVDTQWNVVEHRHYKGGPGASRVLFGKGGAS